MASLPSLSSLASIIQHNNFSLTCSFSALFLSRFILLFLKNSNLSEIHLFTSPSRHLSSWTWLEINTQLCWLVWIKFMTPKLEQTLGAQELSPWSIHSPTFSDKYFICFPLYNLHPSSIIAAFHIELQKLHHHICPHTCLCPHSPPSLSWLWMDSLLLPKANLSTPTVILSPLPIIKGITPVILFSLFYVIDYYLSIKSSPSA